ncbi:EscU/YscU/HrcU family type III secretion system export apparatus switch protein [Dongia deserti]|uniref:EscU/YscU/HrcU family type III secretion system export apparatus switch protein n=1 Tax=Dongia deserti TaxID=2268030 RepID=UPI000E65A67C|nr:EscU/YscU/HrcU family type III secretion system export apparatus switch protein [Dongia deserti]
MAERKDEIGAKHTRWSRPDSTTAGQKKPIAVALDAKGRDGSPRPKTPRVVATGRGPVAEQILAIAFQKGVPVREDSDLAQILAAVELDAEIPIDALAAVAEILSYVYRANRTWSGEQSAEPTEEFGAES